MESEGDDKTQDGGECVGSVDRLEEVENSAEILEEGERVLKKGGGAEQRKAEQAEEAEERRRGSEEHGEEHEPERGGGCGWREEDGCEEGEEERIERWVCDESVAREAGAIEDQAQNASDAC